MRADHAPSTRHDRVLAVVAILLTAFAALSPALMQTTGSSARHLHALKAVGYTTADQGPSTVRMDQTAVTVQSAPMTSSGGVAGAAAYASTDPDQIAVAVATSRGPPGGS
jgi:hypothetical protein